MISLNNPTAPPTADSVLASLMQLLSGDPSEAAKRVAALREAVKEHDAARTAAIAAKAEAVKARAEHTAAITFERKAHDEQLAAERKMHDAAIKSERAEVAALKSQARADADAAAKVKAEAEQKLAAAKRRIAAFEGST
jgi:hypothetical protein